MFLFLPLYLLPTAFSETSCGVLLYILFLLDTTTFRFANPDYYRLGKSIPRNVLRDYISYNFITSKIISFLLLKLLSFLSLFGSTSQKVSSIFCTCDGYKVTILLFQLERLLLILTTYFAISPVSVSYSHSGCVRISTITPVMPI